MGVELCGRRLALGGLGSSKDHDTVSQEGSGKGADGGKAVSATVPDRSEESSTACVVTGLRLAVAATSTTQTADTAAHAAHTHATTPSTISPETPDSTTPLRPVFRVDRFGGSWGPVLPRPPPPGAWANQEIRADDNTSRSTFAPAAAAARDEPPVLENAVDLELMGATLDVTCEDAVALDINIAAAIASLRASTAIVSKPKARKLPTTQVTMEGVNESPKTAGAGALAAESATHTAAPRSVTTMAVTMIDICIRAHAVMAPVLGPGLHVRGGDNGSGDTGVAQGINSSNDGSGGGTPTTSVVAPEAACVLDLSVPLSQVTLRPSGAGWRLETSGWHLTYHDNVSPSADPAHPVNSFQSPKGGGVGVSYGHAVRGSGEPVGRGGLNAATSSRVMTVENGAVDSRPASSATTCPNAGGSADKQDGVAGAEKSGGEPHSQPPTHLHKTTAVTADGVSVSWHPDAHFMVQEVVAASSRVAASRAARRATTTAGAPQRTQTDPRAAAVPAPAPADGVGLQTESATLTITSKPIVSLDLSRLSLRADITPGAAIEITAAALTASDAAARLEFAAPAVYVNGFHVAACDALALTLNGYGKVEGSNPGSTDSIHMDGHTSVRNNSGGYGISGGGGGDGSDGVSSRSGCSGSHAIPALTPELPDAPARRKFGVAAREVRLSLPWGLDLGDAQAAVTAGVAALTSVGGLPFATSFQKNASLLENQSRDVNTIESQSQQQDQLRSVSSSSPSLAPVTELTLQVLGSLNAEVHDSPLSRCLRGKAALLAGVQGLGFRV